VTLLHQRQRLLLLKGRGVAVPDRILDGGGGGVPARIGFRQGSVPLPSGRSASGQEHHGETGNRLSQRISPYPMGSGT
jgi:hypothetical protein